MNFSNIAQYYPTDSVIHKLDPRAKLFSILFLVSSLFAVKNFVTLLISTAALFTIILISKLPFRIIISSLKAVFFLIIFTFVFNIAVSVFSISFYESFMNGLFMSARLIILMMYAILLPLTTSPIDLADGITHLLKPFRKIIPVNDIAMMLGITIRFIPLLVQETDKITKSQISRGAKLDQGNIFKKIKAFFPVLVPLFVIIFKRADEVALSMEVRGYGLSEIRTRRKVLNWNFKDTIAIIISIILMLIYIK